MAKIILTARYVKNISPGQMKNYVKYIATRPNSEKYSLKPEQPSGFGKEFIRNDFLHLLKEVSNIIEEDYKKQDETINIVDRKLQQKIQEKKEAHGLKMG